MTHLLAARYAGPVLSRRCVQELQKSYVAALRPRLIKTLQRLETIKWQLGNGSHVALGAEEVSSGFRV